jgi:hypothetical protein
MREHARTQEHPTPLPRLRNGLDQPHAYDETRPIEESGSDLDQSSECARKARLPAGSQQMITHVLHAISDAAVSRRGKFLVLLL